MLKVTRKFFATVVVLLLVTQLDVSAQGRNAVLGGRAKRTQGGGVKQNIPGLTGTRKRTLVNQVVTGVVNSKPNSNSGKRQVTNLQRRISLRVPIRILNVSGEPIGLSNIYMWGLKGSSLWTILGYPRLPGSQQQGTTQQQATQQQGGQQQGGQQQGGQQQGGQQMQQMGGQQMQQMGGQQMQQMGGQQMSGQMQQMSGQMQQMGGQQNQQMAGPPPPNP